MKKIALGTMTLIMILTAFFVSCDKSDESTKPSNEKLNVSDFEYIGELHNEGLELSLKSIKKKINFDLKRGHFSQSDSLIKFQKEITNSFINKQKVSNQIKKISVAQVNLWENNLSGLHLKTSTRNSIIPDTLISKVSFKAQLLLKDIFEIMDDLDMELNSLKSRITKIEKEAIQTLNTEEQFLILATSSVAKHTLEYWQNNYIEWLNLSSETGFRRTKIFNWKAAGKADVNGAALAGLSLAVSGTGAAMVASGPAGWTGIGLVVVGSGMMSSAARMIWDL